MVNRKANQPNMASPHLPLLVLFWSYLLLVVAVAQDHALVAPVSKHPSAPLYTITLNSDQNYVVDLSLPFSWLHCKKGFPHVPCRSPECSAAQSYPPPPSCPSAATKPKSAHRCTCAVTPSSPVNKSSCAPSQLTYRDTTISRTNGHSPTAKTTFPRIPIACAPRGLFRSLPAGVSGAVTLSRAPLALQYQFRSSVRNQLALCLPSTPGARGVVFFGTPPFYLLPPPGLDVTRFLSYAPLVKHPQNPDYYLDLAAVSINGRRCEFLARMLEFDSLGHGGVKLSTAVPYTSLRSHVYRYFLKQFAEATRGIPRAKKVAPFDLCLDMRKVGSTRVGPGVPQIDLELTNGKNWTVFGANSMKRVSDDVACLAFVDGGERAEQSVVIGSYQMEDNLLMFDLVGSRIGFSSSLLWHQTTCSNFNFTSPN